MTVTVEHPNQPGNLTREALELSLQNAEGIMCLITAIKAVGGKTQSTHDDITEVPALSLALVLEDAQGNPVAPPAGATSFCRGTAVIDGASKNVALFRKAVASAS